MFFIIILCSVWLKFEQFPSNSYLIWLLHASKLKIENSWQHTAAGENSALTRRKGLFRVNNFFASFYFAQKRNENSKKKTEGNNKNSKYNKKLFLFIFRYLQNQLKTIKHQGGIWTFNSKVSFLTAFDIYKC